MRKTWILLTIVCFTLTITWQQPVEAYRTPSDELRTSDNTDLRNAQETLDEPLEETNPDAKLHTTVEGWIRAIAEQHKLVPWQEADYRIEPLGPGTHGWLVHVLDQQTPVGYLIVNALPEGGYRLAEYGVGDRPIFSMETLRASLVEHGLIQTVTTMEELKRALKLPGYPEEDVMSEAEPKSLVIERHYLYPFAAYWKVYNKELKKAAYFDAMTGEQYPLDKDPAKKPASAQADIHYQPSRLAKLKDRLQLAKFDPYEDLGWIVEEPLKIQSIDDVIAPLRDKQRLTLTVELFNDTVLLPFPIIGYAKWEQAEAYLLLYNEGLRYVPLIDAIRYGHIYLEQDAEDTTL